MSLGRRPNREVARLRPYLGGALGGLVPRGIALLFPPKDDVLCGFVLDARPGHGSSRWLHAFGLPLRVPADFLSLSFGRRVPDDGARGHDAQPVGLGSEAELRATARVMETEGLAEIARWRTAGAFRRTLARPFPYFCVHRQFAAAVLAAQEGDLREAAWTVGLCQDYVRAYGAKDLSAVRLFDPEATEVRALKFWEPDVVERMSHLREPCLRDDREAVDALLRAWRAHTVSTLGIGDLYPS